MNEEIETEALKRIAEEKNMSIEEIKKYREYSSRSLNGKEWIEYLKLCEKAFKNSSKYLYVYEHEIKQINEYIELLQQENKQLKENLEKIKQPTIFIDTQDMEERYGEQLYQDYLEEQNKNLKDRINKAIETFEECKLLLPHEFDWGEQVDYAIEILKGSDNNG